MMTALLWFLAVTFALEIASELVYQWKGYRLTVTIVSFAYVDAHVVNWHWLIGKRVRNERDDDKDWRHIPRTVRDHGFAVEPFYFRVTFKKTVPVKGRDGGGREYESAEQRLRVHEHQRLKHGRVLPDYTEDDYDALVGKWTPEAEAQKKLDANARREAKRKARELTTE